ncbi:MAG: T9SS type A sorting domain-containing protein [Candidatus Limimorpha sp.]
MKKLLLSLTLIISVFAASAQNIEVYEKETGEKIESGASYVVFGDGAETWGELSIEFDVIALEKLTLIGEKVENNVIENTLNYICFGQCLSPTMYVSNPTEANPGEAILFSAHYMSQTGEPVFGEQSMTYYIYEESNPDAKFVINVIFKYSLESVSEFNSENIFSNAYPTPASETVNFDYNFPANVNSAEISIYNMMGQEVLRNQLNGMSGKASINVSDLSDGVYFYSLIINGKVEKSNKIVVKK